VWPPGSFSRHGMPQLASDDTGTALGQDSSDRSRDLGTLTFDLGGHGAYGWCESSSSICVPSLKFVGLVDQKIWCAMCVSIKRPGMTLTFDLGGHDACGWCGSSSSIRIPSLKFVGLAIRKIWRTMCVSINGPGDLLILKLDYESHQRWGTLLPNLGTLGLWFLELFAMYAMDGRTDKQTDGQKQRLLPLPYGGVIISVAFSDRKYRRANEEWYCRWPWLTSEGHFRYYKQFHCSYHKNAAYVMYENNGRMSDVSNYFYCCSIRPGGLLQDAECDLLVITKLLVVYQPK